MKAPIPWPRGKPLPAAALLLFLTSLILLLHCPLNAQAAVFNDLAGNPNAPYIDFLGNQGIVSGYPDGTFKPDQTISRAEAATLLVLAMQADTDSPPVQSPFPDIDGNHWAYPYVCAAYREGYVHGFEDGTFRPDQEISRAEAMTMVLNLSGQSVMDASLPSLADVDEQHWAAPYVSTALAAGMCVLNEDAAYFYPDASITRGEMGRALAVLLTTDPELYTCPLEGTIDKLSGSVAMKREGEEIQPEKDMTVMAGDTITTNSNGIVEIAYPDGSALRLESDSRMEVDRSIGRKIINIDGSASIVVEDLYLKLPDGAVFTALASKYDLQEVGGGDDTPWYKKKNSLYTKIWIDMPWGIAAIEGTFARAEVSASEGNSLSCLIGTAFLKSSEDESGVLVEPGNSSSIGRWGQEPGESQPMTERELRIWVQQEKWVMKVVSEIASQGQYREENSLGEDFSINPGQYSDIEGILQHRIDLADSILNGGPPELPQNPGRYVDEWSIIQGGRKPVGIDLDNQDRLWVLLDSPAASRIVQYTRLGMETSQYYAPQGTSSPGDICAGQDPYVFITDTGNGQVLRLNTSGYTTIPQAQIIDPDALPASRKAGLVPLPYEWTVIVEGLLEPCGVCIDQSGLIYVADRSQGTITRYNRNGFPVVFTDETGGNTQEYIATSAPDDVAVGSNGLIYVSSRAGQCIRQYSPSGALLNEWRTQCGDGSAAYPEWIDIDNSGNIFASDRTNDCIHVFRLGPDDSLETYFSFGSNGQGSGRFNQPRGIAASGLDAIFIADSDNFRIEVVGE